MLTFVVGFILGGAAVCYLLPQVLAFINPPVSEVKAEPKKRTAKTPK